MSQEKSDAPNRRSSSRIAIDTGVVVEYPGGVIRGRGADFSDTGMLVRADEAPAVDTKVTLRCTDDSGKRVTVQGRVLRHHAPGGKLQGFVVMEER